MANICTDMDPTLSEAFREFWEWFKYEGEKSILDFVNTYLNCNAYPFPEYRPGLQNEVIRLAFLATLELLKKQWAAEKDMALDDTHSIEDVIREHNDAEMMGTVTQTRNEGFGVIHGQIQNVIQDEFPTFDLDVPPQHVFGQGNAGLGTNNTVVEDCVGNDPMMNQNFQPSLYGSMIWDEDVDTSQQR